jgi:hypothetical protein
MVSQDGYAIPIVVFLGLVLVTIAAVVVGRSIAQSDIEVTDARFEQAFHAAEGGADIFLVDFREDPGFSNHVGTIADKDEAIAAARAIAAADPTQIIDTTEGEAVIVSPDGEDAYYAVGFMPSIDDSLARVRVVETAYETEPSLIPWVPKVALLFNEDALIPGQVVLKGPNGSAHTNGDMDAPGGKVSADSCVTSSGTISAGRNKISVGAGCPVEEDAEGQPKLLVPEAQARDLWVHTEFQLCPDGSVRAGPAHATGAPFAGGEPCMPSAQLLGTGSYRGWRFAGLDPSLGAAWVYDLNQPRNGAYYVYQGSAAITSSPANWELSLVTEARGDVCAKVGGDIAIHGNIASYPYGGAAPIAFFADRDLEVAGNKNTVGHMIAREQLLMTGNPAVEGSFTTVDECDSEDSFIHENIIDGSPVIRYDSGAFAGTGWLVPLGPPVVSDIVRGEM